MSDSLSRKFLVAGGLFIVVVLAGAVPGCSRPASKAAPGAKPSEAATSNQAAPEKTPEKAQDNVSEKAPESTPEKAPESVPEKASEAAAEKAPVPAQLLVELPSSCNTPDGMALLPDNSIILSVPNFNDETQPSLLIRVTPDNKAETFYEFTMPYPGLTAPIDRIGPMGIVYSPANNSLYFADMQLKEMNQNSRLWRLELKDGKVDRMVLVASGFNVSNGMTIKDDYLYVTESVLRSSADPKPAEGVEPPATFQDPLISAVMRFKLDEENVQLSKPLESDSHVITTFKSHKTAWPFGADGIAFDSKGNLFVGAFGDGIMYKVTFDAAGNVVSNEEFAKDPRMINCDGMSCDKTTDKLYVADSAANAIQIINPDGSVETLAVNDDVTDKRSGMLDQPCEALLRGDTIVVSNMDWPFPGFKNKGYQLPATLSVIPLK
jgi:DNA-binding beta-propeller fold protein YncE